MTYDREKICYPHPNAYVGTDIIFIWQMSRNGTKLGEIIQVGCKSYQTGRHHTACLQFILTRPLPSFLSHNKEIPKQLFFTWSSLQYEKMKRTFPRTIRNILELIVKYRKTNEQFDLELIPTLHMDYSVGLQAFKRIVRIARITDSQNLSTRKRGLHLKISHLEETAEKTPNDLKYKCIC